MEDIHSFENDKERSGDIWLIGFSPEGIYQCNLQYIEKLCEVISEVYDRVYVGAKKEKY